MNTHDIDIKLPPLPSPPSLIQRKDWYGAIQAYARSYGMECARAAIEAGRKRTAELLKKPVHVHSNMCRGIIAPITFDMLAHVLGEEATNEWLRKRRGEPVAYLDLGMGGYMDVGTDLTDEQLAALPKGRHMLAIVGTYGVDGYTEADPQPADPVKVPSGAEIWQFTYDFNKGSFRDSDDVIDYARALLARYSHLTATTHKSSNQNQLK